MAEGTGLMDRHLPYAISHPPSSEPLPPAQSHPRSGILWPSDNLVGLDSYRIASEGKSHEACCLCWWERACAPRRSGPESVHVRHTGRAGESHGAGDGGGSTLAKTVPAEESMDPRVGHRRDRGRSGSHLGSASRRRLAADERKGARARTVGELVLFCGAADP